MIPPVTSAEGTDTSSNDEPETEVCPTCKGAGFLRYDVPVGHPDFGRIVPCRCRQEQVAQRRQEQLEKRSNLGPLRHLTFENLSPEGKANEAVRRELFRRSYQATLDYAQNPVGWLVLVGPPGCGKTHLAAAVANYRLGLGEPAIFMVVPDLLDHLRSSFAPTSDAAYDELFEEIKSCPLLILDDLGTQSSTPWAQEKLFQIANHRYHSRLPTVVTTGCRIEEIDERLRARLTDPTLSRVCLVDDFDYAALQRLGGHALDRLQDKTFDTWQPEGMATDPEHIQNLRRALRVARGFAEDPQGWLVLLGGTARGKTHLAAAIANWRIAQGQPALFVVVPDLLDYLRATFAPDSPVSYDRVFDAIRTAPLLVLDDLGAHSSTPWAEEKLFQLLNFRYNAKLPTVITTNLLMEQHDPRLASRMLDPRLSLVFAIEAPPFRLDNERQGYSKQSSSGRRRGGTARGN